MQMPKSTDAIQAKMQLLANKLDNLKTGYQNDILLLTEHFQEEHSKLTGEMYDHSRMLEEEFKKKEETMALEFHAHYEAQFQQKLTEAEEDHQQQLQEKGNEVMLLKEENERLRLMLKQKDTDLEVEDDLPEAERERQRSRRRSFRILKKELERDDGLPESPLDPVHAAAFQNYKLPAEENENVPNGSIATPTQKFNRRRTQSFTTDMSVSAVMGQTTPSASIGTGIGRAATARRARDNLNRTAVRRRELAFTSRRRLSLQGGAVRMNQSTNQGKTQHSIASPTGAGSGGDCGERHDRHRTQTGNWRADFH